MVIISTTGEIANFRHEDWQDQELWDLPQGGIDLGEEPLETLWRELKEEVGLTQDDVEVVSEYPSWTVYADIKGDSKERERIGQAHYWYFLKLKNGCDIDLSKATEREYTDFRWTDWQTVIDSINERRMPIYSQLRDFYRTLNL